MPASPSRTTSRTSSRWESGRPCTERPWIGRQHVLTHGRKLRAASSRESSVMWSIPPPAKRTQDAGPADRQTFPAKRFLSDHRLIRGFRREIVADRNPCSSALSPFPSSWLVLTQDENIPLYGNVADSGLKTNGTAKSMGGSQDSAMAGLKSFYYCQVGT